MNKKKKKKKTNASPKSSPKPKMNAGPDGYQPTSCVPVDDQKLEKVPPPVQIGLYRNGTGIGKKQGIGDGDDSDEEEKRPKEKFVYAGIGQSSSSQESKSKEDVSMHSQSSQPLAEIGNLSHDNVPLEKQHGLITTDVSNDFQCFN